MIQDDTNAADIMMGDVVRLEDVLSRDSVTSVAKSFYALFGLPVRVISHEGDLLADASALPSRLMSVPAMCIVNGFKASRPPARTMLVCRF